MNNPDQTTIERPLIEESADATGDAIVDHLQIAQTEEKSTKETYSQMMGMVLRASLQEINEYKTLIDTAKTQAKKDFYLRKIKKVTKRLSRLLPT